MRLCEGSCQHLESLRTVPLPPLSHSVPEENPTVNVVTRRLVWVRRLTDSSTAPDLPST